MGGGLMQLERNKMINTESEFQNFKSRMFINNIRASIANEIQLNMVKDKTIESNIKCNCKLLIPSNINMQSLKHMMCYSFVKYIKVEYIDDAVLLEWDSDKNEEMSEIYIVRNMH